MEIQALIEKGVLKLDLSELVRDEALLRAVAKTAIFEELLLEAVAKLAVTNQVEWKDDPEGSPWWIGTSGRLPFERMRIVLAGLADETSRKTIELLTKQRDKIAAECNTYQTRAWEAEDWIRSGFYNAFTRISDEDYLLAKRIISRPAHAAPLTNEEA